MHAKEYLTSTPLESILTTGGDKLISCTIGCRMDAAISTLDKHKVLSIPVLKGGEYTGCISVNDLLKELMAELKAKNAHWQDAGAASFTADDLISVGKVLTSKSVGELEHAGSLFLLNAANSASLHDFIVNCFDIKDQHHVHHRVYVCMAAGTAHTVGAGATTVVNATPTSPRASGKLEVTHVVSHLDIVRVLAANKASLGGMAEASLEALGLDEGAVFCVPAATPALEAFQRMAADHKSCLGLVDPDTGKLVANLSASDLRFLSTPEAFASLLTSAVDLRASLHGGTLPPVGTVTPGTTFGELLDLLVSHKLHRAYVVDEEGKPTSIITLTDVLKRVVA